MSLRGALLIGGASRRMGSPKSLLPWNGKTLGLHLCHLLQESLGTPPVLSGCGNIGAESTHFTVVPDRLPGQGPLSALLGLFDFEPQACWLVLATDLPHMNRPALAWLIETAKQHHAPALWPRLPNRPFGEPLAALYRPAARPFLEESYALGRRSLHRALPPDQRAEPLIPPAHGDAFKGTNTPEEWAAAQAGQREPRPS